jgi:hypothetical protein
VKQDKLLVSKLRELKTRHSEIISSASGTVSGNFHNLPEEEANLQKENT